MIASVQRLSLWLWDRKVLGIWALPFFIAALLKFSPFGPLAVVGLVICFLSILIPLEKVLYFFPVYVPFHIYLMQLQTAGAGTDSKLGPFTILGSIKDLLLIFLVCLWVLKMTTGRKYKLVHTSLNGVLFAFLCLGAIHILNYYDAAVGFWGFRNSMEFIVLFYITVSVVQEPAQVRNLLLAMVYSAIPVLVYGFVQFLNARIGYFIGPEVVTLSGRLAGIFGGLSATNVYGVYLMIITILALGMLYTQLSRINRLLTFLVLIGAGFNLLFTFSRRAWIGAVAGMLILSQAARDRRILAIMLIGVVAVIIASPQIVAERFDSIFTSNNASNQGRFHEWRIVASRVFDNPWSAIYGMGMGMVGPVSYEFDVPGKIQSHSYYMLLLGQMGVPGLLLFIALVGTILVVGLRGLMARADKEPRILLAITYSVACAMLVTCFFGITLDSFPPNFYFWLDVGLLFALVRWIETRRMEQ